MRGLGAAIVVAIVAVALAPHAALAARPAQPQRGGFDGGPLALMLLDALRQVASGDYAGAHTLATEALHVRVTEGLEHLHERVWGLILSLTGALTGNGSVSVYQLYRDYLDLKSLLNSYSSKLLGSVADPALRRSLQLDLKAVEPEALSRLRAVILSKAPGSPSIGVEAPKRVEPGSNFTIHLTLPPLPASCLEVRATLSLGAYSYKATAPCAAPGGEVELTLRAPTAPEAGVGPGPHEALIEVYAAPLHAVEGLVAAGYASVEVDYLRPRIYFEVPARVDPGSNVTVNATMVLGEATLVEVSIYAPNGTLLYAVNETISPGPNRLVLPTAGLPAGFYTAVFKIYPAGPYAGASYSSGLAVLPKRLPVVIGVPRALIGPPFRLVITITGLSGNAGEEGESEVIVVLDGHTIWRGAPKIENGKAVIEAPISGGVIGGAHRVVVRYYQGNPPRGYAEAEAVVYTIDPLAVLALLLLAPLAASASEWLERAATWTSGSRDPLVALYRRVVERLSPIVEPPRPPETLREYYSRAKALLGRLAGALQRFLLAYEEYLYSNHEPPDRRAAEAARELGV